MNYCVIDENGIVQNIILYDGISTYIQPEGILLVQSDIAGIGWTYENGIFTNPNSGT